MIRILKPTAYLKTIRGLVHNTLSSQAVNPFYASFKVTCRCHFGCPFCNVKKDPVPDLSTDQVKAVLDNLHRSSVLMVSFEGGEPLLRADIEELLRYARTRSFYLLFTTSVRNLFDYPLDRYAPLIDFLHVSIDEGHNNLELFDLLPRLCQLPTQVSVQTVVTRDTLGALESKVQRCFAAGANIVVIPASHMDGTDNQFPDIDVFEATLARLRKNYPATIHTPAGYVSAFKKGRCSSASVIIAPDARLYYPCHIRNTKGPDLTTTDLTSWLKTPQAQNFRNEMKSCPRNCGWYQYYSIDSYTSFSSVWETVRPLLRRKRVSGR